MKKKKNFYSLLFSLIIVFSCVLCINASNVNIKEKNMVRNELLTDISPINSNNENVLNTELVANKVATQPTVLETEPSECLEQTEAPQKNRSSTR